MSNAQGDTQSRQAKSNAVKDQPLWAVPAVLAIIMVSSGVFMLLLAKSIEIFSSLGY